MGLESFNHGYGQCSFHIVLVPKYRHSIFLDAELKKSCEEALRKIASRTGCRCMHCRSVLIMSISLWGCILTVRYLSSFACSNVTLQGDCSKSILSLRVSFGRGHLWSRGKFYRSIGQVNAEPIKRYIEQSKHQ